MKTIYYVENIDGTDEMYMFTNKNSYQEFVLSLFEEYVYVNEMIRMNWYIGPLDLYPTNYNESFDNYWFCATASLMED